MAGAREARRPGDARWPRAAAALDLQEHPRASRRAVHSDGIRIS